MHKVETTFVLNKQPTQVELISSKYKHIRAKKAFFVLAFFFLSPNPSLPLSTPLVLRDAGK